MSIQQCERGEDSLESHISIDPISDLVRKPNWLNPETIGTQS